MKRATIIIMLASILCLTMATPALAEEGRTITAPDCATQASENVLVFNDPELMARAQAAIPIPAGVNNCDGLTITNRRYIGEHYYPDEPFLADRIQGPMQTGPNITFEKNQKASYTSKFGVTAKMITAQYGTDFSTDVTVTRRVQFDSIPAGKWLEYKAFVNFSVYEFDVCVNGVKIGTDAYWVPVGVIIVHKFA